ncbi:MAG TPA: hypothetical protein VFM58_01775 [Solirubrobacteraceae bacterium]|jgi:hypothetical protein|nr:hypothetical protein [Solirubrobacteraceae bacterium]
MHTTSHHLSRIAATALTIGAALAPTAAAQQDLRSPDTRDAAERGHMQDLRMPDTQDSAVGRGLDNAPVVEYVDVAPADDFDWTDALAGAATSFGIVLLGAGGVATVVRLRRRPVATRS